MTEPKKDPPARVRPRLPEGIKLSQHVPTVVPDLPDTAPPPLRFEVVSDQIITIDYDKALEYVALPQLDEERNATNTGVQNLYDAMVSDGFLFYNVNLATAEVVSEGGKVLKLNCHHTCWSVLHAATQQPGFKGVGVREIRFRVPDMPALRALYNTFDRNRARTPGHCTAVAIADRDFVQDIPKRLRQKLMTGFKFWRYPNVNDRQRITPAQAVNIVEKYFEDLFVQVGKMMLPHAHDADFTRTPVLGAMLATFHAAPDIAKSFWEPVVTGLRLSDVEDPRFDLHQQVPNLIMCMAAKSSNKKVITAEDMYNLCVADWNKWCRGVKCKMKTKIPGGRQIIDASKVENE